VQKRKLQNGGDKPETQFWREKERSNKGKARTQFKARAMDERKMSGCKPKGQKVGAADNEGGRHENNRRGAKFTCDCKKKKAKRQLTSTAKQMDPVLTGGGKEESTL